MMPLALYQTIMLAYIQCWVWIRLRWWHRNVAVTDRCVNVILRPYFLLAMNWTMCGARSVPNWT